MPVSFIPGSTAASTPVTAASAGVTFVPGGTSAAAPAAPTSGWFVNAVKSAWTWYWGFSQYAPFGWGWLVKLILLGIFLAAVGFTAYTLYKNAKDIIAFIWGLLTKLAVWAVEALKTGIGLAATLWALVCLWVFWPFASFGAYGWNMFVFMSICFIAAGLIQWRFKPWGGTWGFKAAWLVCIMSAGFILLRTGAPELMEALRGSSEATYFRIVNGASTRKDVKLAKARKEALLKLYDRNRDTLLNAMQQPTLSAEAADLIGKDLAFELGHIAEMKKEMGDLLAAKDRTPEEVARIASLQSKLQLSEFNVEMYKRDLTNPTIDEALLKDLEYMIEDQEKRKARALTSFESPTIAAATNEIHDLIEQRDRLSRKIRSGLEPNNEANRKKLAVLGDKIAENNAAIERTERSLGRGFGTGPFTYWTIGAVLVTLLFLWLLFFHTKTLGGKFAVIFLLGPIAIGAWMAVHFMKQGIPWSRPHGPAPARSTTSERVSDRSEGRASHASNRKSGGGEILHQAEGQGYEQAAFGPDVVSEPIAITATGPFSVYWFDQSTVHWAANGRDIAEMPDFYVKGVGPSDPQRKALLSGRPGRVPALVEGRDVAPDDFFEFKSNHVGFGYFVKAEQGVTITVRRSK